MRNVSKKIAKLLFSRDTEEEKIELYGFSIYILFSSALHIGSLLVLGWLFGMMVESILFYISFIVIRKFAGGYHAKTPLRCYFLSVLTIAASLFILKHLLINNVSIYSFIVLAFISLAVFLCFSPLGNNNTSDKEKKIYRLISITNSFLLYIISLIVFSFNQIYGLSILFGIVINAIVLLIKKVQLSKN